MVWANNFLQPCLCIFRIFGCSRKCVSPIGPSIQYYSATVSPFFPGIKFSHYYVVSCKLIPEFLGFWRIVRRFCRLFAMYFVLDATFVAYLTIVAFWAMSEIVGVSAVFAFHLTSCVGFLVIYRLHLPCCHPFRMRFCLWVYWLRTIGSIY